MSNASREDTDTFIQTMFNTKVKNSDVSFNQFRNQMLEYARILKRQEEVSIDKVNEYINTRILHRKNINVNRKSANKREANAFEIIKNVTHSNNREIPNNSIAGPTTDNGWFQIPTFHNIDANHLTNEQVAAIENQYERIKEIYYSIPSRELSRESSSEEIIGLAILKYFRQVTGKYLAHLESVLASSRQINKQVKNVEVLKNTDQKAQLEDLFNNLKETKMIDRGFDLSGYNISSEDMGKYIAAMVRIVE